MLPAAAAAAADATLLMLSSCGDFLESVFFEERFVLGMCDFFFVCVEENVVN